ncbi:MAG: acylphosphatase [Treponema sp.]|nr:acylphosphatase [Treponema sp.]
MEIQNEKYGAFYAQVQGRVQGVGFRYSALAEAKRLGLCGWVRNTEDGKVEVWAEGPPEKLAVFCGWLHRGPEYARVDSVIQEAAKPIGYKNMGIKY